MKTFLRNLLGTPTTPARKAARLGCEALEAREVPAGLNAVLASGVLTVTGTPGNDAIRVVQSPDTATYGSIRVDGTTIRVNGQARASVPDYLVTKVVENGGAGNDALSFVRAYRTAGKAVNPAVAAVLDGGTGDNKYPNGNYNDIVIDPVLTQGRAVMKTVLDKWVSTGGVAGALGKPTADDRVLPGGAHAARFQRGDIYWSAATGTRVVFGAVRDKYNALGGAAGFLGLPTRDQESGKGMTWGYFQGGAIVSSAATGAHWLAGPVLAKYEALGGGGGFLGAPVEDQRAGAGMEWVHFQGGAIVSSAAAGARVVYGAILEKYLAFGGGGGMLGAPVSDEQAAGAGRVSRFERGDIYWSEATGARVVFGAVRDKYDALGGAAGFLGLPTGDLTFVGAGIMTRFQGGDIYWSGATGAHVVYGDILTKFNALGGVGFCGFPVSDEVAVPGGRASFFEDADIYWSAATGAHEVHGGFRDRYNALGGAGSRLGLPIDELRYNIDQRGHQFAGAYWYQDFQYGQL